MKTAFNPRSNLGVAPAVIYKRVDGMHYVVDERGGADDDHAHNLHGVERMFPAIAVPELCRLRILLVEFNLGAEGVRQRTGAQYTFMPRYQQA